MRPHLQRTYSVLIVRHVSTTLAGLIPETKRGTPNPKSEVQAFYPDAVQ